MSRLDELIKKLCPNGVEYKALGEIFDTKNGYTPSKSKEEYWTNGTVPWFRMEDIRENGNILSKAMQYVSESAIKGSLFPADSIIVATSATIGQHALIKVPSLANQRFTYLVLKNNFKEKLDIMFIYYYCFKLDEYCKECLNQGNFASVDMKKFLKFKLPVPPLEVQAEIVRILDNFTELEKELEKELELRRKQYEYYRDLLLNFKDVHAGETNAYSIPWLADMLHELCPDGVEYKMLGDVSDIVRGASPRPIKNFITNEQNGVNWIKIGDVKPNEKYIMSAKEKITTAGAKKSRCVNIGDFILSNSMSFGRPYILKIDGCIHDGWLSISGYEKSYNRDFLYYILISTEVQNEFKKKASFGGAVQNLNSDIVKSIILPVPPLAVQRRIVDILDRFDALCNDLTSGLPAEIALRRKQYEYYRDKLLNFKKLKEA